MKAVKHHVSDKWILLYVMRWLTAPIQDAKGECQPRLAGVPQVRCRRSKPVIEQPIFALCF
ncbi:MAG: hypothetical protein NTZ86_00465 [Legionellales bacterium]|nr:hypothetical protein [Legionellales bacterium]